VSLEAVNGRAERKLVYPTVSVDAAEAARPPFPGHLGASRPAEDWEGHRAQSDSELAQEPQQTYACNYLISRVHFLNRQRPQRSVIEVVLRNGVISQQTLLGRKGEYAIQRVSTVLL
jgi:hypothetical protein